jgi:hypothetical protein
MTAFHHAGNVSAGCGRSFAVVCAQSRRGNVKPKVNDVESWRTEDILRTYERVFGRLPRESKLRIIATARASGWDRTWDE